jgi:hypothetical protein
MQLQKGLILDCKENFQLMDPLKFVTQMVASQIYGDKSFIRLSVVVIVIIIIVP